MEAFFIKLIFFLLSFNIILTNNNYTICPEGKYGEECEKDCKCEQWSSSNYCSKIEGRCLDCKFGHYGANCQDRCYPTCKTNLCCAIKSSNFKKSNLELKISNSKISMELNKTKLNILVDYNVGYPLAIFKKTTDINLVNSTDKIVNRVYYYNSTKYSVEGKLYENYKIKFLNQEDLNIELPLPIILDENLDPHDTNVNGIIGLGFYNHINEELFQSRNKLIVENIASYKKKGEEVSILFGDLFKEEKNYVHKLSFCKAENQNQSEYNISCKIEGFGSKSYSDVLQINDTYIRFSLDTNSYFVLPNKEAYTDYIKKYFFKEENYKVLSDNQTTLFCYKSENINRLSEFGFVINHFLYFFSADHFFIDYKNCSEGYSLFIIRFSDLNPGLIFGKNFYSETQFTLDNEENKIYFYSKYVEYFSGEIKAVIIEELSNKINPLSSSFIMIGISLFLNIVTFLIYFYFKRKKELKKLKKY